jgi:hypothetical protein
MTDITGKAKRLRQYAHDGFPFAADPQCRSEDGWVAMKEEVGRDSQTFRRPRVSWGKICQGMAGFRGKRCGQGNREALISVGAIHTLAGLFLTLCHAGGGIRVFP